MKKALLAFAIGLAMLEMTGCATLGSSSSQATEQLVVEYATIKVVRAGGTLDQQHAKQAKIIAIATQAQTVLGSPSVTLAALQAAVSAQIAALKLAPEDQMLADALVKMVAAEVSDKVGTGALNAAQVVTVNTVLGWVVAGASFPIS